MILFISWIQWHNDDIEWIGSIFFPCCTNVTHLVPLLSSFLPLLFHWFLHAELMAIPLVCCYHYFNNIPLVPSCYTIMVFYWFLCCYHSFHCIGTFHVIITSITILLVPSCCMNTNGIPLVPLHCHWSNWFSFAVNIDSCCINGIFLWWVLFSYHSFYAHSILYHWIDC